MAGVFTLAFTGCGKQSEAGESSATAPAPAASQAAASTPSAAAPAPAAAAPTAEKRLPRLVDLGAGTCIPCKMMKPILEDLMATRTQQFETVFIDINHRREEATRYRIRVIPTQIFFDENGQERGRHEGFMSKEQILETWKQFGFDFGG